MSLRKAVFHTSTSAAWTSLSEPAAERPLTVEVLVELGALVKALKK